MGARYLDLLRGGRIRGGLRGNDHDGRRRRGWRVRVWSHRPPHGPRLNNCPSKDYDPSTSGGRLDIYRKLCHTTVEPISTPKSSTVPTPTYSSDASTDSDDAPKKTPAPTAGESDGAYTLGATGLAAAMVLAFA